MVTNCDHHAIFLILGFLCLAIPLPVAIAKNVKVVVAMLTQKRYRLRTQRHRFIIEVDRHILSQFTILLPQVDVRQVAGAQDVPSFKVIFLAEDNHLGHPHSLSEVLLV